MRQARALLVAGAFACGSALIVAGCGGDDDIEVAFGGSCVWDLEELDPEEGDPEGSVRMNVLADCDYTDTGFGVLAGTGTAFISPPNGTQAITITSNLVYTDGDGDTIQGIMVGEGSYGGVGRVFTFTGTEDFGNGTGGFAGATASADADGLLDLEGAVGPYDTDGTIDIPD